MKKEDKPKDFQVYTPLQAFVSCIEWDATMIIVILMNSIWIAMSDPTLSDDEVPTYQFVGGWMFSSVFIFEFIMKMTAFGFLKYFQDGWNYLDFVVVMVSLIELAFLILSGLGSIFKVSSAFKSLSVLRFLRILRLLRLLRPLKAVKFIPAIRVYVEALSMSVEAFLLNGFMLITVCMAFAFITNDMLNTSLQYRCMPTNLSAAEVVNNTYYQAYGMDYFYSRYNTEYCNRLLSVDLVTDDVSDSALESQAALGSHQCSFGYTCLNMANSTDYYFLGVGGDFSSVFRAFVTNMSFLTVRGWPNIFWAVAESKDLSTGFFLIVLIFGIGAMLVVNMFPAIFLSAIKLGEERHEKMEWLMVYPGDKNSLTEFELMVWANANKALIYLHKPAEEESPLQFLWKRILSLIPFIGNSAKNTPNGVSEIQSSDKTNNKKSPNGGASSASAKRAVADDEEEEFGNSRIEQEADPTAAYYCVPRCSICVKLRKILDDETSAVNMAILGVIVLNIVVLAMDSDLFPNEVQDTVLYCNLIFTSIFLVEAVVKISIYGPFLYFSNTFNCIDFALVTASIPLFFEGDRFRFINNLRILRVLRLARLVRLARIYRVVANVYQTRNLNAHDPTVTPGRLLGMLGEFIAPMSNVILLNFLVMFIFACLGSQLFGDQLDMQYTNDDLIQKYYNDLSLPRLQALQNSWGARYSHRLNFNNFLNGFVTVYNLSVLNNWYITMISYLRVTNPFLFIFFFSFLFLAYYVPQATLLASVINVVEADAHQTLKDMADDNKFVVNRVGQISVLCQTRNMFRLWHKNAVGDAGISEAVDGNAAKRPEIPEAYVADPKQSFIQEFMEKRKEYSFYLFSEKNFVRKGMNWLLHSSIFAFLILLATMLVVAATITESDPSILSETRWHYIDMYCTIAFLVEMVVKWFSMTLWGTGGYFYNAFNWLDFTINAFMVLGLFFDIDITQARIIRLIKLPSSMQYVMNMSSMKGIVRALNAATFSIGSVILACGCVGLFFSIFGVQIWSMKFSYCNHSYFPASSYRYESMIDFPMGCDGYTYVNSVGVPIEAVNFENYTNTGNYWSGVDLTNATQYPLKWKHALDSFDGIFNAARSVLRVMGAIEWQGVMFGALDSVDQDYQPHTNSNRSSFIFFFLLYTMSCTFSFVSVAVIYYHYFIIESLSGRRKFFGEDQAYWITYEDRLRSITPSSVPSAAVRMLRTQNYKIMSLVYILTPFAFFLDNEEHVASGVIITLDFIFNLIYIGFYVLRIIWNRKFSLRSSIEKFDFVVLVFLIITCFTYIDSEAGGFSSSSHLALVKIATIARFSVLGVFFPLIYDFFRNILEALPGFLPQILYVVTIIFIFGVFGTNLFETVAPYYGNSFLEEHYNFQSYGAAWVTLLAMGTGNVWTEIVAAYKAGRSDGYGFLIDVFFTAFFLAFTTVFRAFPLLVVYKYMGNSSGTLQLAGQQIRQFQFSWDRVQRSHKKKKGGSKRKSRSCGELLSKLKQRVAGKIDYDDLCDLIKILPPPLGMKGQNICFLELSRFTREVLTAMPADITIDAEIPGCKDMLHFPHTYGPQALPVNLRSAFINGVLDRDIIGYDNYVKFESGFSFQQLLIAVHKRAISNAVHVDSPEIAAARNRSEAKLRLLRFRLIRIIATKNDPSLVRKKQRTGYHSMILLQRKDPILFRALFISVMTELLSSLMVRANSYGFRGFDAFLLSKLRLALKPALHSAALHMHLCHKLSTSSANFKMKSKYQTAKDHYFAVKKLSVGASDLFNQTSELSWNLDSFEEAAMFGDRAGVTAVGVDLSSRVFAAFSTGIVKIYYTGDAVVKAGAKYVMHQSIETGEVRCLHVSPDGRQFCAAISNSVVVYSLRKKRRVSRSLYAESFRFSEHGSQVNCIQSLGPFYFSGSNDYYIMMWDLKRQDPLKSYYCGASVFCMRVFDLALENISQDENALENIVVSGTSSGYLVLNPIPSLKASKTELTAAWQGISIQAGNCAVSALEYAWGYLYSGLANGSVTVWALTVAKPAVNEVQRIGLISLSPLMTQYIHAGPVTAMLYGGGSLFSSSHDFSVVPWLQPEKLNVKVASQFSQEVSRGLVFHFNPITSMAINKFCIVTGDCEGRVIISSPKDSVDSMSSIFGSRNPFNTDIVRSVVFSFLEYDFKECFIRHQKYSMEDETILTVTNIGASAVTIRYLQNSDDPCFSLKLDWTINDLGVELISTSSGSKKGHSAIELLPFQSFRYRVVFAPTEDVFYRKCFEFLVGESDMVKVNVRGIGAKAKLTTAGNKKDFDFGTVQVSLNAAKNLNCSMINKSKKDIVVNCIDESDQDDPSKPTLQQRNVSVLPRCFLVKAHSSATVTLRFQPDDAFSTFHLPLRFKYCGGNYKMGTLSGRSEHVGGSSTLALTARQLQNRKASHPAGLRRFKGSEAQCHEDVMFNILGDLNWGFCMRHKLSLFFHKVTGMFIELPVEPTCHETIDAIQIRARSNQQFPYAIWHEGRKILSGLCQQDQQESITVCCDQDIPRSRYGRQTLDFHVFDRNVKTNIQGWDNDVNNYQDHLVAVYHIKIVIGVRFCRRLDGPMEANRRISVLGIERAVSRLKHGMGDVYEVFGTIPGINTGTVDFGSAAFSAAVVSMNKIDDVTKYKVEQFISTSKSGESAAHKTVSGYFSSNEGHECVRLPRPAFGDNAMPPKVYRRVGLSFEKEIIGTSNRDTQTKSLHEDVLTLHEAGGLSDRGRKMNVPPLNLLPVILDRGDEFNLEVEVVVDSEDVTNVELAVELSETLDAFHGNPQEVPASVKSARAKTTFNADIHGYWYFLVDGNDLKLVSADPEIDAPLEEEEDDLPCTEITFLIDGALILCEGSDRPVAICGTFEHKDYERDDEIVRRANTHGVGVAPVTAPQFLLDIWDVVLSSSVQHSITKHFLQLARARHSENLARAATQAAEIVKEQEQAEEAALASRANKRLTPHDRLLQQKAQKDAKAILDSVPSLVTYKEVFLEMIDVTENFGVSSGKRSHSNHVVVHPEERTMDMFKLRRYLERTPVLGGTESLFTVAQSSKVLSALPCDSMGCISLEAFRAWYVSDEGRALSGQLTEETTFARILHAYQSGRELNPSDTIFLEEGSVLQSLSSFSSNGLSTNNIKKPSQSSLSRVPTSMDVEPQRSKKTRQISFGGEEEEEVEEEKAAEKTTAATNANGHSTTGFSMWPFLRGFRKTSAAKDSKEFSNLNDIEMGELNSSFVDNDSGKVANTGDKKFKPLPQDVPEDDDEEEDDEEDSDDEEEEEDEDDDEDDEDSSSEDQEEDDEEVKSNL